jgi:hypothetical protein
VTPEAKAEWLRQVEGILGQPPTPRPKVVARNDLGVVRDAVVRVSRADPNAPNAVDKDVTVEVRRPERPWERRR